MLANKLSVLPCPLLFLDVLLYLSRDTSICEQINEGISVTTPHPGKPREGAPDITPSAGSKRQGVSTSSPPYVPGRQVISARTFCMDENRGTVSETIPCIGRKTERCSQTMPHLGENHKRAFHGTGKREASQVFYIGRFKRSFLVTHVTNDRSRDHEITGVAWSLKCSTGNSDHPMSRAPKKHAPNA